MATLLSDVIVPEVFDPYMIQRTEEKSELRAAGIIGIVPGLNVPGGGATVNMPHWNDLTGDDEVMSDERELVPGKIQAGLDIATVLIRAKAWGANELASALAGDDALMAIGELASDFWVRSEQRTLISILTGVFGSPSMSGNMLDLPDETVSRDLLIDAISLLGDSSENLTGMVCHSAVRSDLAKKEVLDARVNVGDTNTAPEFQSFLGRRVIADDGCPVETLAGGAKVYTTYLFGNAAIGFAPGNGVTPSETERKALAHKDFLVTRRHFILHPRGVKWVGKNRTAENPTPGNAELADGENWERVWEPKAIRIAVLRHRIGTA